MHFLNMPMRAFWLHESVIKNIECQESEIIVSFKKGFFTEEHKLLENCLLKITINKLKKSNIDSYVSIIKFGSRTIKKISFLKFVKHLDNSEFVIDTDYYSEFERAFMILGKISKKDFCFKVTDIDSISFMHN